MSKINHKNLPEQEPNKVIFVYNNEKYILEGNDLKKWFSSGNLAAVQAQLHGVSNLYSGIEWEKLDD